MGAVVQARLDEQTQAALEKLVRRTGWTASRVIREGIRLVEERRAAQPPRMLIGVGMFDSGIADLATNKKHMEDFGQKSLGRSRRKQPTAMPTKRSSAKSVAGGRAR
jgi:hypothetical protein